MTFSYGICTRGEDRCAPPLTISIRHLCDAPGALLAGIERSTGRPVITESGTAVFVLTATSVIEIAGNLDAEILRAVPSALRPYGASRTVLGPVFDEFPPPDLDACGG